VCALPLTEGDWCGACLARAPAWDAAVAAYAYAFPVDALIAAYKYRGDLALAPLLAAGVVEAAAATVDVLVPVPLSAARLRQRGFNQARELARVIGRELALPVLPKACRRVTDTVPQASLPWRERTRNVKRAFVCDADLSGLRVAVVDDVMTTGATMNELAKVVTRCGASRVEAWVVARALPRRAPGRPVSRASLPGGELQDRSLALARGDHFPDRDRTEHRLLSRLLVEAHKGAIEPEHEGLRIDVSAVTSSERDTGSFRTHTQQRISLRAERDEQHREQCVAGTAIERPREAGAHPADMPERQDAKSVRETDHGSSGAIEPRP
jgi:ComF family protein